MTQPPASTIDPTTLSPARRRLLFGTCFIALVATSFSFIVRANLGGVWGEQFGLSQTQTGEIFGAGLWPFAISIVLLSLVIDRIGYRVTMWFALACHLLSVLVTLSAGAIKLDPYWVLWTGSVINGLGNGAVEAAINPIVAGMYRNKTKWLTILHAGWPGGLALGGILTLSLAGGPVAGVLPGPVLADYAELGNWRWQQLLLLVPMVIYGVLLVFTRFTTSERVAAGVPYRAMLREVGTLGMWLVLWLVCWELTRVANNLAGLDGNVLQLAGIGAAIAAVLTLPFAVAVRGYPGHWLFLLLMVVMIPLATTELGTDAWIDALMTPAMAALGETWFDQPLDGLWVLIYTASLMMVLRLTCGPLVRWLGPLGILAMSCIFAAVGISFMSVATGLVILAAATVYGIGQSFFWPATLGLVAERFPRGGAMTLNGIAAVGMLGVGVIGTQLLGTIQDDRIEARLLTDEPALHGQVIGEPQTGLFGSYRAIDQDALEALPDEPRQRVQTTRDTAKRTALLFSASLPLGMLVVYLLLIAGFRLRGGYKPVELTAGHAGDDVPLDPVPGVGHEGPVR
jgi:MFS family permease